MMKCFLNSEMQENISQMRKKFILLLYKFLEKNFLTNLYTIQDDVTI